MSNVKSTDLISEDTDGCGSGHFIGSEPDGSKSSRDAQDEDLCDGAHCLSRHQDRESILMHRRALNPRTSGVQRGC